MTFKQILALWWSENKTTLITLVVSLITALLGLTTVAYDQGQKNPEVSAVIEAVESDPLVQEALARTPTQPSATATQKPSGRTPSPTLPQPTATVTPAPFTSTPTTAPGTPSATVTAIVGNPCQDWHPFGFDPFNPSLEFHTHGYDPCQFIDIFGEPLQTYLTQNGICGYPKSGPLEEHDGCVWLYVHLDQCELFVSDLDNLPDPVGCPSDLLIRVHTRGDQAHGSKRFHSEVAFVRGCDDKFGTCGIAMMMQPQADYGPVMNNYKEKVCHLPGEPTDGLGNVITDVNQPPYHGHQRPAARGEDKPAFWNPLEVLASEIWSSLRIAANEKFYPNDPNPLVQVAWTLMDAREYFVCGGEPVKAANNDATRFMFFTLKVQNLPEARPFTGFSDFYGHPAPDCTAESALCFPLYVSEGFPTYPVWFNFEVRQNGDNPKVEQMEFNP